MIERNEYATMAEDALAKAQYLSALVTPEFEIVYVVSSDTLRAMAGYEPDFLRCGTLNGIRIACINESVEYNYFTPAIYSHKFAHFPMIQVNDFVVFNDDGNDHIFRLVRQTPDAMYADTGLTVSFVETPENVTHNTIDNAMMNVANNAETISLEMERAIDALASVGNMYIHDTATVPNYTFSIDFGSPADIRLSVDDAIINEGLLYELAGEPVSTARTKRRTKENALNPGDTKLIDEYLKDYQKGRVQKWDM